MRPPPAPSEGRETAPPNAAAGLIRTALDGLVDRRGETMIQMYTYLDVADNTGAKEVMCIKVLGGSSAARRPGRHHLCSVKKAIPGGEVKKGGSSAAVIVRCKRPTRRDDGSYVRFDSNALVLIDNETEPARHAHLRGGGPRAARAAS